MKNKILFLLFSLLFTNVIYSQQITLNFAVDNIFAAYVGNQNAVTVNKVPATRKDGGQIFTATSVTTNYNPGDWFYIVAWSDDAGCQGMVGEIKYGGKIISTGDNNWEVFPTGKNLNTVGQAPTVAQINQQITTANNSGNWLTPAAGPTNANTTKVCSRYPRPVTGIGNNAKWVWHNANNANSPFYPGFNHGEYLIFRFPMKAIAPPPTTTYDPCCPPLQKKDIADLFNPKFAGSINGPYRMEFNNDSNFKKKMQAYANLLQYTCGAKSLNATIQLCDMGTGSQPGSGYCNTKLKAEYISFKGGQQWNSQNFGSFFKQNLQPNHWYRITIGFYPDNKQDCFEKSCSDTLVLDFNFQTSNSKRTGGTPSLTIKGMKAKRFK